MKTTDPLKWFGAIAPCKPCVVLTLGEDGPHGALGKLDGQKQGLRAAMPQIKETVSIESFEPGFSSTPKSLRTIKKGLSPMTSLLKENSKRMFAVVLGLGAAWPALAQIPFATEPFDRFGRSELYGIGQYLHSEDINFNGPGGDVKLKMDDTGLGGFGMAYHFNDFFSIHADFMFGNATFSGNVPTETGGSVFFKQDAFLQTGRFNIDYNIINRRITPFLTAGLGYQYLETELQNAPPISGCWWDPWWGWVCYSGQPHAWQTDFTWNAGAGIRWNITDNLVVKATVGATWLEYSGAHGVTTQIEGIFGIGWSF